jgi:c-di-GMP-binding flagellar brake protein YcgR
MTAERRRYFRINDTVQLSYRVTYPQIIEGPADNTYDLIAEQDRRMEVLIAEQKHHQPALIELIALLNQKVERLAKANKTADDIFVYRARKINISACGLAFTENYPLAVGAQLQLFLIFENNTKMSIEGLLVDCQEDPEKQYIWRVDFLNLTSKNQEKLIQHVVQRQSTQLAARRNNHL